MKSKEKKTILACWDHVDMAIDDYVNFYELAPQLLKNNKEDKCDYCLKVAEYIVLK